MKHPKSMHIENSMEARELALYAENRVELWPRFESVIKAVSKHYKRGRFDAVKAIDAFFPLATAGSNLYKKDFGYSFTVTERYTAANIMVERFMEDIENGTYLK